MARVNSARINMTCLYGSKGNPHCCNSNGMVAKRGGKGRKLSVTIATGFHHPEKLASTIKLICMIPSSEN